MGAFAKARNEHRVLLTMLQDRKCAYCFEHMSRKRRLGNGARGYDKPINPRRATLDHVWPKVLRGPEFIGNSVAVHDSCNLSKGGRPPTGCELIALAWVNAMVERHTGATL